MLMLHKFDAFPKKNTWVLVRYRNPKTLLMTNMYLFEYKRLKFTRLTSLPHGQPTTWFGRISLEVKQPPWNNSFCSHHSGLVQPKEIDVDTAFLH